MRSLAIARYRILTTIRSARWIYVVALAAAVLPLLIGSRALFPHTAMWWDIEQTMYSSAATVVVIYVLHILILLIACDLFGTRRRSGDSSAATDLTDTAPISPGARYGGDTGGILVCAGAVHIVTAPLLALAVALSPLPSSAFFWLELFVAAVVVLASSAASWKYHAASRWSRTQTTRTTMTFGILMLGIFYFTTRWQTFRDAAWVFVTAPSPYRWKPLAAAVANPGLLLASLLLLYFGFIGYYAAQSVRSLERR